MVCIRHFLLLFLGFATPCLAEPLRIDLSMDTGRNDTATPGWQEWQVANGPEATRKFGEVAVTLRAPQGETLRGEWYKAGLSTGATMATDGIMATALEIELSGLKSGTHSVTTYHNGFGKEPLSQLTVSVVGGKSDETIQPTMRVATNEDAESAFLEFEVKNEESIVVRIVGDQNQIVLNGIEIDGTNPKTKALRPIPTNHDGHADGDSGSVALTWQPASNAVKHHVYFASHTDPAELQHLLESTALVGTTENSAYKVKIDPAASLLQYAWRVDSEAADGKITRGDVWNFRARHLAFPGAEGYGRFAIGGRGGRVIKVTNLDDTGPGSLRAAVEASGPRTVVFDVSGRIVVNSRLIIRDPYLTIAGQTAPGKGICISNYNLGLLGNNDCIIRFIRVRPGNTAGVTLDGMGLASCDHSIIDHCSISWTQDESFSSRGAKNITLQRTLISEALNVAGHAKYEKGKQHGYAASISGDIGSFHHNLLAHCAGRNWSLAGGLDKGGVHAGRLDIRNNVVYNWSHRTTDGGAMQVNFVNNYYKPGAATEVFHVLMAEREGVKNFGPQMYYADGNVMEGRFDANDKLAGVFERHGEPHENWIVDKPFYESYVTTTSAKAALKNVLSDVGCSEPALDKHDLRVIDETLHGKAQYKGSITGLAGLPDTQDDVGGWDDYGSEKRGADWDQDNDGLPTWWEKLHNLNPQSSEKDYTDANGDPDGDGFTNLEDYLNWIATPHFNCRAGKSVNVDLEELSRGYITSERKFDFLRSKDGGVVLDGDIVARFTPDEGFTGLTSFQFQVRDAEGNSTERLVNVRVVGAK
ncbi:MAG: hypothetical protein SH868_19925 [Bythopirellula sp.]|nr:hypothetical protein [Bythopirellula sp.]